MENKENTRLVEHFEGKKAPPSDLPEEELAFMANSDDRKMKARRDTNGMHSFSRRGYKEGSQSKKGRVPGQYKKRK